MNVYLESAFKKLIGIEMKNLKSILISFIILLVIVCGFIINPPSQQEKKFTNCNQYFCVTPAQVTTIYIYHYENEQQVLVGYCTTDENTGCCPDPFSLIENDKYNAKPVCQPGVQGVDFTACTSPNILTLECP
jgi:Phr family secreted Rap phosphatase inhibitor